MAQVHSAVDDVPLVYEFVAGTSPLRALTPGAAPGARVVIEIVAGEPAATPSAVEALVRDMIWAARLRQSAEERMGTSEQTWQTVQALVDTVLAAVTVPVAAEPPGRGLTAAEREILHDIGANFAPMPTPEDRPSVLFAAGNAIQSAQAFTVKQVAALLGLSEARVRQRLASRSLFGVKVGAEWRIPRIQFTEDGELPGWEHICPAFPSDATPDAVRRFLLQVHPDLVIDGVPVSPAEWLRRSYDPVPVRTALVAAYAVA